MDSPSVTLPLGSTLSTGRAVEKNPNSKVGGKVLETVNLACRNKDEGSSSHLVPGVAVEKEAGAARHEVDLVSIVWLLRIRTDWLVHFNGKGTVFKDRHGEIARRRWTRG
jgi:hypothetical protein